jgi:hypothetical protein
MMFEEVPQPPSRTGKVTGSPIKMSQQSDRRRVASIDGKRGLRMFAGRRSLIVSFERPGQGIDYFGVRTIQLSHGPVHDPGRLSKSTYLEVAPGDPYRNLRGHASVVQDSIEDGSSAIEFKQTPQKYSVIGQCL